MNRRLSLIPLLIAAVALSACCRETVRVLALNAKPGAEAVPKKKAAHATREDEAERKAVEAAKDDVKSASANSSGLETGSIPSAENCQGEHIAYQATKEYLKNFGPKPPDEPGEKGPCRSSSGNK